MSTDEPIRDEAADDTPDGADPSSSGPGPATSRAARNASVLAIAEVIGKVGTFAYTVVVVRVLSQADYGAFAYALSVALLVGVLGQWGFNVQLIQRSSGRRDELPHNLAVALVWKLLLGVPVFGITFLVVAPDRPDQAAVVVLALLLVATYLDNLAESLRAAAAALENQTGVAAALATQRLLTAVVVTALVLSGTGIVGVAVGYLAGSVTGLLGSWLALTHLGSRPDFRSVDLAAMRGAVRGSLLIGLSSIASMILFRVDQVLIEVFEGDEGVAAYAVAYRLVESGLFLSWSVGRAVLPVMSAATERWRIRRGVEQGLAALALAYVPFAAVALTEGRDLVVLLFGDTYATEAAAVMAWLAPAPLLFGVGYLLSQALFAREDQFGAFLANGSAMVGNVVMNIVAIPAMGIAGAAMVTSVSLAVRAVVEQWRVRRLVGPPRLLRPLVPSIAGSVPAGILLAAVEVPVLVEVGLAAAVYLPVWWWVTRRLDPEQLEVVAAVVSRVTPGGDA